MGLSGGGTQLATQLAAAGTGELIGVDYQRLDCDNHLSTDAVTWVDLAVRRTKLAAIRRRIWWIDPRCRFTGIASRVPEQQAIDALKTADIIVGCVNNLAARADILEIAGRYCIPYIDIGLTVRTPDDAPDPAPIVAVAGHVFGNLPGGPCFWCSGYLTKKRLEAEAGGVDSNKTLDVIAALPGEKRYLSRVIQCLDWALADYDDETAKLDMPYMPDLGEIKEKLRLRAWQVRHLLATLEGK